MGDSGDGRVLRLDAEDATMMDIGDKNRPPGDSNICLNTLYCIWKNHWY
ncbi:unnamed protein product [Arabidopsis halleri]